MLQKARLAALRGGEGPGIAAMSKTTVEWLQRLRKLFPEVPAELLERVLPDDQFDPELLPWNRHVRRGLKKADEIILHLFSGPDERTWKELETKIEESYVWTWSCIGGRIYWPSMWLPTSCTSASLEK